jgi:hypothetical protein
MLQIPIYAAVAERLVGRPVRGGLYRSLSSGKLAGFWLGDHAPEGLSSKQVIDSDEYAAMMGVAQEQARSAAEGIRRGDIQVRPSKGACQYCGLEGTCDGS